MSAWAAGGVGAQTRPDESGRPEPVLDLVAQTPATAAAPAVIALRVASDGADATLRARLYEPVTTRAELTASLAGPPPTPLMASWVIEDVRAADSGDGGTLVSVPIRPPAGVSGGDPASASDGRPLPLHLELATADGTVIGALATFLTPAAGAAGADPGGRLAVAVVLDLRLSPAHSADGGADPDPAALDRVLGLARVLIERDDLPLTVEISPETLDALALIGDDSSAAVLRAALEGRQLLATPWTSLEIADWVRVGRADVVIDGLERSAASLRWIGMEAGTVMRFEEVPAADAAAVVTNPAVGVRAFVARAFQPTEGGPPHPVTLVADAAGGSHPTAQADPLLEAMLRYGDPELGAQWALAELRRIAAAGTPDAVLVLASALRPSLAWEVFPDDRAALRRRVAETATESAALELLLDGLSADRALRPVTVDAVLAELPPVGTVAVAPPARPSDPGDFGLYLARRAQVELRLHAYESLIGDGSALAAPLRTLLAVSASPHLTTGERTEFLNAVDRQATQGATGVEFAGRGRITITERSADLPVTLFNNRSAPVTVALELTSDKVDFPEGSRSIVRLEPGRNDLSVPIEAKASGRSVIAVAVTTPDEAGTIALSAGTLSVRYAAAEGLGSLILVGAAAALAAWWLQARRGRSRAPGAPTARR